MKGIKKLTAIVLLALVASLGASPAFGGTAESPGVTVISNGTAESPGCTAPALGTAESPGITAILIDLFAAML